MGIFRSSPPSFVTDRISGEKRGLTTQGYAP
jgi:hypothetical protein